MNDWSAELEIEIPFHDVDMMNVVWHGRYVRYFELSRCLLFDKIDYNYKQMKQSGYAWPVIDLRICYLKAIEFQQKILIKSTIVEYKNRLKIKYIIKDMLTGVRLTKGYTTQVAVNMKNNIMCFASPHIFLEKLGVKE